MTRGGAEVFSLLGNETRLRIIQSLGDLSEPGEFSTISFSRLHEASEVSDSGTFNYHLQKLVDRFVHSVDGGYELSLQGINVYRGLRAGIFETDEDGIVAEIAGRQVETDRVCTGCGEQRVTWIEDGRMFLGCHGCNGADERYPVPAGGLRRAAQLIADGDGEGAYLVLRERLFLDHLSMLAGFCPYCDAATDVSITSDSGLVPDPDSVELGQVVTLTCGYCHWYLHSNLEMALVNHPTVVQFLWANGLDFVETDLIEKCESSAVVRSTDPWRLEASVALSESRIVLELDREMNTLSSHTEPISPD